MNKQELEFYQTPATKPRNSEMLNNSSTISRRMYSTSLNRKRRPIFDIETNYKTAHKLGQTILFKNQYSYGLFEEQFKVKNQRVLQYDHCGCQDQTHPCSIIQDNFLNKVSLTQMKKEYQLINITSRISGQSFKKKRDFLLSTLPSFYPEIYNSHLTNLLKNIGIQEISNNQFICLSWIQYHCKIEYITYFIYTDLRKSMIKPQLFLQELQSILQRQGVSLRLIRQEYAQNKQAFQKFVVSFYQSMGSIVIPVSHYSQFLSIVFKKGTKAVISLLKLLMSSKKQQTHCMVRFIHFGEINKLRDYTVELSWQNFLSEIQK